MGSSYKAVFTSNITSDTAFYMMFLMFTLISYFKVFYSIISFISVNVVDYFRRLKFSAKMFFHDPAVLKNDFPFNHKGKIATRVNATAFENMAVFSTIKFRMALVGTKNKFIAFAKASVRQPATHMARIFLSILESCTVALRRAIHIGIKVVWSKSIKYIFASFTDAGKNRTNTKFLRMDNNFFNGHSASPFKLDNLIVSNMGV